MFTRKNKFIGGLEAIKGNSEESWDVCSEDRFAGTVRLWKGQWKADDSQQDYNPYENWLQFRNRWEMAKSFPGPISAMRWLVQEAL